ncbi:Galactose mutarotase [bacterium A37T11]|nr:Galactose mutarotase [bacterium A37T11]
MILENGYIKIVIDPKGAELKSIWSKIDQREYLWGADPAFWGKSSPVLFPIVGALKQDTYRYQGKEYHLPRHGFAREQVFAADQLSEEEGLFTITDTEATRAVYPFSFKLGLRYKLLAGTVTCTYEVENTGAELLLFSIGGHPAFAIGGADGLEYEDWYLNFFNDTQLVYHPILDNLIADRTETLTLKDHQLPLNHALFYNDALVLKSLKSNQIFLVNRKNPHGLLFSFQDFPYFGIWAAKDANFICLEPWCGIADGVGHNQLLGEKEGIISLPARGTWNRTWTVTCV